MNFTRIRGIAVEQHVLEVEGGGKSVIVVDVRVWSGVERAADENERHIFLVALPSQIDIFLLVIVFVFIAATAAATAQPTQSRALVLFAICINGIRIILCNCRLLAAAVEYLVVGQPRRQFAAERLFLLHFAAEDDIAPRRGIPLLHRAPAKRELWIV